MIVDFTCLKHTTHICPVCWKRIHMEHGRISGHRPPGINATVLEYVGQRDYTWCTGSGAEYREWGYNQDDWKKEYMDSHVSIKEKENDKENWN